MKKAIVLFSLSIVVNCMAQQSERHKKIDIPINNTNFSYYASSVNSRAVVLVFHDWFGVSELSFEMIDRINSAGLDVLVLDLYKGKSAKTNQQARGYMNSIDMTNVWDYIDAMVARATTRYNKIFFWGFSLGTQFASQSAIKHNSKVNGLILFYGNTPRAEDKLSQMTFPSLMVMGSKDNPRGAINFFNALNKGDKTYASLFIYPNVGHAYAQKLFNEGKNYNEDAKEASFEVAFRFIKEKNN